MRTITAVTVLLAVFAAPAQAQGASRRSVLDWHTVSGASDTMTCGHCSMGVLYPGHNVDVPSARRSDSAWTPLVHDPTLPTPMPQRQEGSSVLFRVIGTVVGAGVGYLYGERNTPPDSMMPVHVYSVPLGALAGLLVGNMVDEYRAEQQSKNP